MKLVYFYEYLFLREKNRFLADWQEFIQLFLRAWLINEKEEECYKSNRSYREDCFW